MPRFLVHFALLTLAFSTRRRAIDGILAQQEESAGAIAAAHHSHAAGDPAYKKLMKRLAVLIVLGNQLTDTRVDAFSVNVLGSVSQRVIKAHDALQASKTPTIDWQWAEADMDTKAPFEAPWQDFAGDDLADPFDSADDSWNPEHIPEKMQAAYDEAQKATQELLDSVVDAKADNPAGSSALFRKRVTAEVENGKVRHNKAMHVLIDKYPTDVARDAFKTTLNLEKKVLQSKVGHLLFSKAAKEAEQAEQAVTVVSDAPMWLVNVFKKPMVKKLLGLFSKRLQTGVEAVVVARTIDHDCEKTLEELRDRFFFKLEGDEDVANEKFQKELDLLIKVLSGF